MNRLQIWVAFCLWLISITLAGYFLVYVPSMFARATNCPRISRIEYPSKNHSNVTANMDYFKAMRLIPGGTFQMGKMNAEEDERPEHKVSVSEFQLGATPVTVEMYKEYCSAMKIPMPQAPEWGWNDGDPMVNVSWDDIMGPDGKGGYCAWASGVTGVRVTLPTEQQFEFVARNGIDGQDFPWGRTFDDSKVWSSVKTKRRQPAPVRRSHNIHVNRYGVSDMTGNVMQWCLNGYASYSVKVNRPDDGTEVYESDRLSIRGGTYLDATDVELRVSDRVKLLPYRWHSYLGFRICFNSESAF
jgi:formylglycine-generating enzyme required for sulfatase activity